MFPRDLITNRGSSFYSGNRGLPGDPHVTANTKIWTVWTQMHVEFKGLTLRVTTKVLPFP